MLQHPTKYYVGDIPIAHANKNTPLLNFGPMGGSSGDVSEEPVT